MAPDLSWESVQGLGGQRLPGAATGAVRVSPLHVLPPPQAVKPLHAASLYTQLWNLHATLPEGFVQEWLQPFM